MYAAAVSYPCGCKHFNSSLFMVDRVGVYSFVMLLLLTAVFPSSTRPLNREFGTSKACQHRKWIIIRKLHSESSDSIHFKIFPALSSFFFLVFYWIVFGNVFRPFFVMTFEIFRRIHKIWKPILPVK